LIFGETKTFISLPFVIWKYKNKIDMLYFWITNASRAHRAGKNEGSGKSSPICVSGKHRRGRKKELLESQNKSCSETQLDKICQKNLSNPSLNGSTSQVSTSSGGNDVPWIKSRSRGSSAGSSSSNNSSNVSNPIDNKQKLYTRKTSSTSLW